MLVPLSRSEFVVSLYQTRGLRRSPRVALLRRAVGIGGRAMAGVVGRKTGPAGADGRCASAICVGSMIVARCRSRNIGAGNRPAHDRCAGRPSEPGLGRRRPQENSTMSDTQVAALDHTVQQTNVWLKRLGEELHIDDRHVAYSALRAVLHVLRDRLTAEQAVHLGAQLPLLVRGLYYEGWRLTDRPATSRPSLRLWWRPRCLRSSRTTLCA